MGSTLGVAALAPFLLISTLSQTQQSGSGNQPTNSSLQVTSRAVLIDVIVMDSSGKPIMGLSKDAFTLTEQGKPQAISFFEENGATPPASTKQLPKLPPNTFTNLSFVPQPPAVNVLLLDSLNTRMENQSDVHRQVLNFLRTTKPGTRCAIFTMGLGLHFIQGFNDDPAVLAAALENRNNNEVESSVMLKSPDEVNAQKNLIGMMSSRAGNTTAAPAEMITALQNFLSENDSSQTIDRGFRTLSNLQRLAAFLEGFPGRKNIIWFAERVPGAFLQGGATGNPRIDDEFQKTFAMLATARAAIYPVDSGGVSNYAAYTAESNLPKGLDASQLLGPNGAFSGAIREEGKERVTSQSNAKIFAGESGGRAFANTNDLTKIIEKVTSDSSHFYTLSYSPINAKMDGTYRKIDIKVEGGKYDLSYRRGYFAIDTALPGSSTIIRDERIRTLATQNPGGVDPLLPFMDLGMPQTQQVIYEARISPQVVLENELARKKNTIKYRVDFSVDSKTLGLNLNADGRHQDRLRLSLIAYDRYGNIVSRDDRIAELAIRPDELEVLANKGVQLKAELDVPKGNYWLRTGIYDEGSRKVGTLEIPLSAVKLLNETVDDKAKRELRGKDHLAPHRNRTSSSESITVRQLEQFIEQIRSRSDKDAAQKLAGLRLRERLTTTRHDQLQRSLPGERSRLALLAIADVSAFLDPPATELDSLPAPDQAHERQMLSRALDSVRATTLQMPNFLAEKRIIRFQDAASRLEINFAVLTPHRYHFLDSTVETVRFRNGKEESDEVGHRVRETPQQPRQGLITTGVFGPMLQTVMHDIPVGSIRWGRWEMSPTGPVAVFRYSVPKNRATFTVTWCCSPQIPGSDENRELQFIPAYHGEIAVDPESGTVLRFTVMADMGSGGLVSSANVFVEYGPVEIGKRIYQCPVTSVTLLTAKFFIVHQDFMEPFDLTSVSHTRFDQYHVFRSEMKILE